MSTVVPLDAQTLFYVKKVVSYLLYPYTVSVILLGLGILLMYGKERIHSGRALIVAGYALLLIQSIPLFPNTLSSYYSKNYAPILTEKDIPEDVKWVVVLSGASNDSTEVPITSRNYGDTLHRVVEGVLLAWKIPDAKLMLSGGSVYGEAPAAMAMSALARELHFPAERIVTESASRDTEDQARLIAKAADKDRILLVTSLRHMPRSVQLFEKYGATVTPAPVSFPIHAEFNWLSSLLPNSNAASSANSIMHELYGLMAITTMKLLGI